MIGPSEKLSLLRSALQVKDLDAILIPSTDPHMEEDVAAYWRIVEWLTGFTGSNATLVVTASFAGLWTDSRYFIQAQHEIEGSGFSLIKPDEIPGNDYIDFLEESLNTDDTLGLDGRLFPISRFRKLARRLDRKKIKINSGIDIISELWTDRPSPPQSQAFDHRPEFSGKIRERKITEVREKMGIKDVDWQFLTSRDEIMWLLNIRGNDLKYSPLLDSFCLVGKEQVILFAEEQKIPLKLASEFDREGIVILPYEETAFIMPSLTEGSSVLLNPVTTSVTLFNSISSKSDIREDISIPSRLKAIKNKTEIDNLSKVMLRDGVALTRFLFWVEAYLDKINLTEKMLCDRILEFRSQQKDFLGPSFATIVSFNQNSALPHYSPSDASNLSIEENGILLIDSGGQYLGGTTDITRTIAIGPPSAGQKKDFTLVLKGHINLARAKFPVGTRGYQLDILARNALWQNGLNYGHGTGHGIGFCLNVHEGPQSISPADNTNPIEPGMILSNEPAIYREGEYGIRTENVILCYEDEETEYGRFLKFDTISLCYIDKNLIDKSILNDEEVTWINTYHSEVFDKISPFLPEEEKLWLKDKTEPL